MTTLSTLSPPYLLVYRCKGAAYEQRATRRSVAGSVFRSSVITSWAISRPVSLDPKIPANRDGSIVK